MELTHHYTVSEHKLHCRLAECVCYLQHMRLIQYFPTRNSVQY